MYCSGGLKVLLYCQDFLKEKLTKLSFKEQIVQYPMILRMPQKQGSQNQTTHLAREGCTLNSLH